MNKNKVMLPKSTATTNIAMSVGVVSGLVSRSSLSLLRYLAGKVFALLEAGTGGRPEGALGVMAINRHPAVATLVTSFVSIFTKSSIFSSSMVGMPSTTEMLSLPSSVFAVSTRESRASFGLLPRISL